jgi:chromate reductase
VNIAGGPFKLSGPSFWSTTGVRALSESTIDVAVFIGSLRRQSINRHLFNAARELAPAGLNLIEAPIGDLPHYNEDLDTGDGPAAVKVIRDHVLAADAVLFITPEYNFSIPGVLKNAIDWLSRPSGRGAINGKPGAVMGAAAGRSGTMRAQMHLRNIFVTLNILDLNKPEVYVTFASDKFDADGRLVDEDTRRHVKSFLEAFEAWIDRVAA